jgi:hypothetical protein
LSLWKCPELKQVSKSGESEGDFRARVAHAIREARDLQIEKLRGKYAPKLATLHEQLRKALQKVEKQKAQASQQTYSVAINLGTSILGAVFGRKLASASTINKAATTMRSVGRAAGERQDVTQAEETVEAIQAKIDELNIHFESEANALLDGSTPEKIPLEEISVSPKKADVTVVKLSLCWTPWILDAKGNAEKAWS